MGKSCSSQWKTNFRFGCRVFYWCLHDGSMFMHILLTLGWCHQALDKSLEGLIDFLAFLVPKLWPKCHKLRKSLPIPYRIPEIFVFFGPKDSYQTLKLKEVLSQYIGSLDQPMTSSKKMQNLLPSWCHQPKTLSPKLKPFFLLWTTRLSKSLKSLEAL